MGSTHVTPAVVPQDDIMDIDNQVDDEMHGPFSLLSSGRNSIPSPFSSMLDPTFSRSIFDTHLGLTGRDPIVTHPREVREIPIEVKDGNQSSSQTGHAPTIEDATGTVHPLGPVTHGTVIIDDDDEHDTENTSSALTGRRDEQQNTMLPDTSLDRRARPSAPEFQNVPDFDNDIEEEMIRAAIEASRREAEGKFSNYNSDGHVVCFFLDEFVGALLYCPLALALVFHLM